jgi:uncharacterized membrane protein
MPLTEIIELVGLGVDALGVIVIIIGVVVATFQLLRMLLREGSSEPTYRRYRQGLGRGLLLGLELLVAGDIIKTVAVTPTLESVTVLGIIVIIRTFLSWSLEVELNGRWPWQRPEKTEVEL